VSSLVRLEAERAVRERGAQLRALGSSASRLGAGGVALLLVAGLLSFAIVRALETVTEGWLAGSLVALGWLATGAILLVPPARRARRLVRHTAGDHAAALAAAEAEVAAAATAFAEALAGELARAEERRLVGSAEHELAEVEHALAGAEAETAIMAATIESETAPALDELAETVGQLGHAGLRALRRLLP